MQQRREVRIHKTQPIGFSLVLSVGCCLGACSASVYPASECKPPPPPLTIPNSPRSQCREVSTEHAKDWPQKYKDIQYLEENAVYRVRLAYSELADSTQKKFQSDFAQAVVEVNNADGKYLQLIDATVGANGSDFDEATKGLSKALGNFVDFIGGHVEAAAVTPAAQKDIAKAKAALQELNNKVKPPPPPEDESKTKDDGKPDDSTTEGSEDDVVKT